MKKAVLIICALCVVMLFAGCGGKKTADVSNSEQSNSVSRVDSNSQSAEENTLENAVEDTNDEIKNTTQQVLTTNTTNLGTSPAFNLLRTLQNTTPCIR